ncbi:MAG: hypothetical protein ACXADL_17240 [Candidatus Thorarchaeota archaeon]|jgi:DNA-directed RNA polymerase subunit RPC12/RpoP
MMEDGYYDPYDQQKSESSPIRWIVFILLVIFGTVGMAGIIFYAPPDMFLVYIFIYLPMMVFLLYAAYRWAQGRPIAPVDEDEDSRILETMRRHALPAERLGGLEMYRCPDCRSSFELVNATPVEDKVVLCPICKTRLFIE